MTIESLNLSNPQVLLVTLKELRQNIEIKGQAIWQEWRFLDESQDFRSSSLNLAYYLALRQQDLRDLQAALIPWGLSSLGRIEGRVIPNLETIIATLELICGSKSDLQHRPSIESFFEGDRILRQNAEALFGTVPFHRRVRIMVTLPSEAAIDYEMVREIVKRGANCVRINCAHDNPEAWAQMIRHVRLAATEIGSSCQVMMDLGGPKIRTGSVIAPEDRKRAFKGDFIVLARDLEDKISTPPDKFYTSCSVPEILDLLEVDTPVYIDDGKLRTRVVDPHYSWGETESGILLQVTNASPKGVRLKPEKGLNFPKTVLSLSPLTEKDLEDLDFVADRADIVGYSFVQQPADIELLQRELDKRCQGRPNRPAIVAKIETAIAVSNLPDLIVRAGGKQPFGVMIARGDLAVEIGYQRLAEIQEEILWLCEAAHVPVIWATQVLESLVKNGAPSRGEMTDAAMAERAECVMLNKGPFIAEAVTILDDVLTRMETHQLKKTPQLRALRSW